MERNELVPVHRDRKDSGGVDIFRASLMTKCEARLFVVAQFSGSAKLFIAFFEVFGERAVQEIHLVGFLGGEPQEI